ncbi:MAG: metallophosphoesterase [Planctomycetes bacterium]|nr:metallophosphoesterase [Planctomycetota bacterium]
MRTPLRWLAAVLVTALAACQAPDTRAAAPPRIVAFGDVHGDLDATLRALRLAGAVDPDGQWCGGRLVVVQTGDQLDRGDDEAEILLLFERLAEQAAAAGGAFHSLLGNHELMNVAGDFRYVTPGGFADFEGRVDFDPEDPELARLEPAQRARAAALRPGGHYARLLATHDVILVLEGNVFVHGGVLPAHLEYGVERINRETRAWLRGEAGRPEIYAAPDSPIWARSYSLDPGPEAAVTARAVLDALRAERMIVGHTIQEGGITNTCGGLVWCVDVGMAGAYGGPVEVLLIEGDQVRVLRE